MFTTLIYVDELKALQASDQPPLVLDCSFDLTQPGLGRLMFLDSHIAGAYYADLDRDLSAKDGERRARAASGGRHPLPAREDVAAWLAALGLNKGQQVVVYDRNGLQYCCRLWWMLKWLGHEAVAVLDGGLQAWLAGGGAYHRGETAAPAAPGSFTLQPPQAPLVDATTVLQNLNHSSQTVLDARATPRYKGEVEPLDPVAGHIPGALNRPFNLNLGPDGLMKSPEELQEEFEALLGERDPMSVVHQCGSGVTATPNLLAMEVAGLGRTTLYAGSWSDWCANPTHPVEKG
jgi:thiosulfate/3-mercaptopyruvate sulfurtransferase